MRPQAIAQPCAGTGRARPPDVYETYEAAGVLTAANEPDFYGPCRAPGVPSDMPPGSWGKVLDLARRYERRESLFDAADAPESARGCHLSHKKTISKRVAYCVETPKGLLVVSRKPRAVRRSRRPCEEHPQSPERLRRDAERKREERRRAREGA